MLECTSFMNKSLNREIFIHYKNIHSNLQSNLSNTYKKIDSKFKTSDFFYPREIIDWFENEKDKKTLILIGKSGFGKT